jgi:hypothetical protein
MEVSKLTNRDRDSDSKLFVSRRVSIHTEEDDLDN